MAVPCLYRVVTGASPENVVLQGARGLLPAFIDAAQDLVRLGAEAITTNCGFLSVPKGNRGSRRCSSRDIVAHANPWVQSTLPPGKRVGIVTVCGSTLTPAHLEAAGVPLDTPLVGTENGEELFRVLVNAEKEDMDVALAE